MTVALFADHIERALLGSILEAPVLIEGVVDLEPQDLFHLSSHSNIFFHLQTLWKKDAGIDLPTLVQSLESSGELDKVGGAGYVSKLVDGCVIENFPSYVKTLKEVSLRRRLAHALDRVSGLATNASVSTEQLRSEVRAISAAFENGIAAERKLRFRTAADLAAETHPDVKWTVGGLVAAGAITLAVGKVKAAGKTTFFTHLAKAVIGGSPFLGSRTSKGPVIYLTEQSDATFRVALGRAGLLGSKDLRMLTWTEISGLEWAEVVRISLTECKRIGAVLLVVDTIGQFTGLVGEAENNAGDALRAMQPLQQAAAEGLGILVSQHERKSGGEVEDSGRGSSAFAGAADIVLNIRRRPGNGNTNLRVLRALSRFGETPLEVTVELTQNGYVLRDSETIALDDAAEAILKVVPGSERSARTSSELCQASGVKRTVGQAALNRLIQQEKIQRKGSGHKGDAFRFYATKIHSAGNASLKRPNETEESEDEFCRQQSNAAAPICPRKTTVTGWETAAGYDSDGSILQRVGK